MFCSWKKRVKGCEHQDFHPNGVGFFRAGGGGRRRAKEGGRGVGYRKWVEEESKWGEHRMRAQKKGICRGGMGRGKAGVFSPKFFQA